MVCFRRWVSVTLGSCLTWRTTPAPPLPCLPTPRICWSAKCRHAPTLSRKVHTLVYLYLFLHDRKQDRDTHTLSVSWFYCIYILPCFSYCISSLSVFLIHCIYTLPCYCISASVSVFLFYCIYSTLFFFLYLSFALHVFDYFSYCIFSASPVFFIQYIFMLLRTHSPYTLFYSYGFWGRGTTSSLW